MNVKKPECGVKRHGQTSGLHLLICDLEPIPPLWLSLFYKTRIFVGDSLSSLQDLNVFLRSKPVPSTDGPVGMPRHEEF